MATKIMAIDKRLSILKKRRKLYQHVEKEIKLLRLKDGYT